MSTSYPHANSPVDEPEWRQFARLMALSGVVDGVGGELAVTASGTNRVLSVAAGRGYVDGFLYDQPASASVETAVADPTYDRIDVAVLRYDPDATLTAGSVDLHLVQGTPAASPTVPALTTDPSGVFEVALAQVIVRAGSSTNAQSDVTDLRVNSGSVVSVAGVPVGPYTEPFTDLGNVSGTVSINFTVGNVFRINPTAAVTIEWAGLPPSGEVAPLTLIVGNDLHAVTWPAITQGPFGDAPAISGETWISGVALSDRVVVSQSWLEVA